MGKEVGDQFTLLISAITQSNAEAWQEYYSRDQFLSAIVNTDQYVTRSAWVDTISNYFSMREALTIPINSNRTPSCSSYWKREEV